VLIQTTFSRVPVRTLFTAIVAVVLFARSPAGAQSPPPSQPSPVPSAQPVADAQPSPRPLSLRGSFRAYDFTRQNASTGIGGAGQVNQQSIELGLALHADYRFANTPFSVGASYLVAWTSNDKRLVVYVTQSYLECGPIRIRPRRRIPCGAPF